MSGSSPGTSSGPPSETSRGVSGIQEVCLVPCNWGFAPCECIVMLPKQFDIIIVRDEVEKCDYLKVQCVEEGIKYPRTVSYNLSIENFVRTISTCLEVEEVDIYDASGGSCRIETWKVLCKTLETIPSLSSLNLNFINSSRLSISDAEAIFEVLGVHNTLEKCKVNFSLENPTQVVIVRVLVDAILQNPILQGFSLGLTGHGQLTNLSNEVVKSSGIMRELGRYMKPPTSVLTNLSIFKLSDDELVELANLLGGNKRLRKLLLWESSTLCSEGMMRMGEMLKINTSIESLGIHNFAMGGKEMKSMVATLLPDATSRIQPNTHLIHLEITGTSIEDKEGLEQLATLLQSNTTLTHLSLLSLSAFQKENENVVEYVEILMHSLWSNASLEELELIECSGIGGRHVLGLIMDMLLHNHTLREIDLLGTRLEKDGDAEVVYAELRTRGEIDRKLEEAIRSLEHVAPNSARVFLCGEPEAGKTTLCKRWIDIANEQANQSTIKKKRNFFWKCFFPNKLKRSNQANAPQKYAQLLDMSERTRGIEVHKLVWEGMQVSLWDMAGQLQYRAFHDLVLPNQSAKGEGCFYFIVCDPTKYFRSTIISQVQPSSKLEDEIEYWLRFLASNTRHSASYRPHVTILVTHHDKWQSQVNVLYILKKIVLKLKIKFEQVLDFDQDLHFISMDNEKSCSHAAMVKERVEEYLKQLFKKLPKVLKASMELQLAITKWCAGNCNVHILRWKDFSSDLFAQVEELKPWEDKDDEYLEKLKKHTTKSLHSGGHVIYFEDIDLVVMNPHWFCNHVIGNILFNWSSLTKEFHGVENGIVSQEDFMEFCKDVQGLGLHNEHYQDTLEIMMKLQICYEDRDKILIPSVLTNAQDRMDWDMAFHMSAHSFNYVGTKLTSGDDKIMSLSEGFFPRLQVYLHDKFDSKSYTIYLDIIAFIHKDNNVFITKKDGSINIMSQSSNGEFGDRSQHDLHKMIINHINDLRQKPTLGCPGVILEEHCIWPICVEHPFSGKLQSVSKKHLKDTVSRTGDLKYAYHWIDERRCAEAVPASKLLGGEEWHKILESRERMVKEIDKVFNQSLATSSEAKQGPRPLTNDHRVQCDDGDLQPHILAKLDSMKTKLNSMDRRMQHNHKEVMERINVMESKIIFSQRALAARLCCNIDLLMEYSLQLKDAKIPKLPYLVKLDEAKERCFLFKLVPGLKKCHLRFRCEHNDHGFHIVEDQLGCEIIIGSDITRKVGIVMFWGLTVTTMLLKVGAHLAAPGMGSMVPDLAKGLATILDTPGLLDLAQPRGPILECLPVEFKANRVINVEDNEEAKEWLVKFLETKQQSIQQMFRLTQVKYSSKSSKKEEIGWVCDAHKH